MINFISRLKEKTEDLSKRKKILLAAVFIVILIALIFVFSQRTGDRKEEFVQKPPSSEQASQSITKGFFSKIAQFFGREEKIESQPLDKITPSPLPTPAMPTIKEILDYIESQHRDDGFYNYLSHYDEQCKQKEGETVCPFEGEKMFPTTNAWTALAYLSGYQALGNPEYLNLAKRDMDKLIAYCQNNPEECLWVLVQAARLYEISADSRYLDFLKMEGEILLTTSDPYPLLLDIETRELAMLFEITGDSRYLEEAEKRLKLSKENLSQREVLYQSGEFSFPQKACWYNLARLEIAKQTGDKAYLEEVKNFLAKANVNIMANFISFPHPIEIQPCIETYFELAKISGEKKYYEEGKLLFEKFIETFWDGKETKLIYGEGGTIFNPYPLRKTYAQKYVVLSDTAYSAYLLGYLEREEEK